MTRDTHEQLTTDEELDTRGFGQWVEDLPPGYAAHPIRTPDGTVTGYCAFPTAPQHPKPADPDNDE